MQCPDDDALAALAQGLASAEERTAFELHLDGCSACRRSFTAIAEVVNRSASIEAGVSTTAPSSIPTDLTLAQGAMVGRYVIVRPLGAGAMGIVFLAYDPQLDRKVALKLVAAEKSDAQGSARLILEARAMARLSHPSVVPVHDAGSFGQAVFIAMEYVNGRTLTRWLEEERPPAAKVIEAFLSAAQGVAAAHEAGIVHRDFKPDNVLVGEDGRVRVTDFGLARASVDALDGSVATTELPAEVKTRTGALVGTPAYMAPEQLLGQRATPASDQFAFCVSLFQGLAGARPFQARTVGELLDAIRRGPKVDELPVSRTIKLALAKGLSARPEDRFPTMDALAKALSGNRSAFTRNAVALLGLGAVLVAGGATVKLQVDRRAALCSGGQALVEPAWSDSRSAEVRKAFGSTKLAYAEDGWRTAASGLDTYAANWVRAHKDACEATRVRGEQTEALLTVRMVCLERRRKELSALVDVLAAADQAVVQRAAQAVRGLPLLSECADVDQLATVTPRPTDPRTREALDALDSKLARTRALLEAGGFAAGLALAKEADADAERHGYRPAQGEARYLLGIALHRTGDRNAAVPALEEASWLAESGRADIVAARARTELVFLVGYQGGDFDGGLAWARRARASIERLGGSDDLEGGLEGMLGVMSFGHRDFASAVEHDQRAQPLLERALGPEHRRVASVLDNLGSALQNLGRRDEALVAYRRALELRERVLGPNHPDVGTSHNNLGTLFHDLHRNDEALAEHRKALALWTAVHGPDHPATAFSHANLALVAETLGRLEEAETESRRALELFEKDRGPTHPMIARILVDVARIATARGKPADALPLAERAVSIAEGVKPPENDVLANTLVARGNAKLALGQTLPALTDLERAATFEKTLEHDGSLLARLELSLAKALIAAKKDPARVRELAHRAKAAAEQAGDDAQAAEAARLEAHP